MSDKVPDPVSLKSDQIHKDEEAIDYKKSDSVDDASDLDDEAQLHETEALEARLASGEATEAEYLVESAHDVAVKVLCTR